jgi:tetratricopeptide (TPR) repeat protein
MEKEASYHNAAECYEKAWNLGHATNAAVGFKLSFNYLKSGRAVEAIAVCNTVLKQYPAYPKIREEILEKAYALLRP